MNCHCGAKTRVMNTKSTLQGIRRQRVCTECNMSFNTTERSDEEWQQIVTNLKNSFTR